MFVSQTGPAISAYMSDPSTLITSGRVDLAISALVLYEYATTFSEEVNLFWMRKKTGASWLFFAIRYLAILFYVFISLVSYAHMSDEVCITSQKVALPIEVVQYVFWAAFSGLRVLALSGMNWLLGGSVFLIHSGLFVMCVWEISLGVSGANVPVGGCTGGANVTSTQDLYVVTISRCCVIVADLIVMVVTWRYSVRNGITMGAHEAVPSTLASILLVNGTVYFLVLLALNVIQLVSIISIFHPPSDVFIYFTFVDPLTAILICRLMLSLQSAHQRTCDGIGLDTLTVTEGDEHGGSLRFATALIGSIAEPVIASGEDTLSLDAYGDDPWPRDEDVPAGSQLVRSVC